MDDERRRQLAREALDGSVSGPDAPIEATAAAMARAESARTIVLVEGISDQLAVEALAGRLGRDFAAEGIVVVPIGGAHAVARFLRRFGPQGGDSRLVVGLCDVGEELFVRKALQNNGFGVVQGRHDLERLGFFVCERDLEDELIRAAGRPAIEDLLRSQGDLGSFRTLGRQPAWRGRQFEAQLRRWLGAGAGRKLRYARLIVQSLPLDRMPAPLTDLLSASR